MKLLRDIFLVVVGALVIGVLAYEQTSDIVNESPRPVSPVFELPRQVGALPPAAPAPVLEPTPEQPPIKPTVKEEVKPKFSTDELYARGLEGMVNLLCDAPGNQVIIVSGFLISGQGHILTNAHLSDKLGEKNCQVRRGSPARAFAVAKEVFKPAGYERGSGINEKARYDIAIWKMVESDTTFSAFNLDPENRVSVGETLVALSYPSELLGYETILRNLSLLSTLTKVTDTDDTIIVSSHTLSSQMGSSGGALLSTFSGEPVGIIFGVGEGENIAERILYSVSIPAVNRIILEETGETLADFVLTH